MEEWFKETGIRVICIIGVAIVLYVVSRLLIPKFVKQLVSRRMADELDTEVKKRADTLSSILVTIAGIVILIVAVLTLLPEFGVDITTLIAGIGVGGLAIAFAAQNLVRDFITGFFILSEDQYRIGDVITAAGISGAVEDITIRRTILRDLDGVVHSIPNGKVEISSNMTKKFSRVNLDISVGYGENLKWCMELINAICKKMAEDPKWKPDFITTPAVVGVNKLGDSGIDIKVMGDTKPSRQWDVMRELRLRIKDTFDSEGIEIPWPHTKIYFGNSPTEIKKN